MSFISTEDKNLKLSYSKQAVDIIRCRLTTDYANCHLVRVAPHTNARYSPTASKCQGMKKRKESASWLMGLTI
jgi:hypothetical protein